MQVFKFDNAEKDYFIGVSSRAFGTMEYTALGKNSQFSEGLECSLVVLFKSLFASLIDDFMEAWSQIFFLPFAFFQNFHLKGEIMIVLFKMTVTLPIQEKKTILLF